MGQQITFSLSIAANTTDQNVLQTVGARIRTIEQGSGAVGIELLDTGSAVGLERSFFVGSANPVENSIVSTANRVPLFPDDAVNSEPIVAFGGEQLQITVTNTTGGALTYFWTLKVTELDLEGAVAPI
jgi:hypothetical protein